MRYVTYYEEFPIYEPAEGGYYYAGEEVLNSKRLSKRKAKELMKEIWKGCEEENAENPDEYYQWNISDDGNEIWKESRYIGCGLRYVIERKLGSRAHGWKTYC